MYRALLISVVITTAALIIYFSIFYSDFGAQFIDAASYVAANNPSYLPALSTVTLLFSFVNPALGALLAIAILVALLVNVYVYIIALARMVFAASFDRLVPERFSKVSDRFHSPFVATLLVGALTGIWITIYSNNGFAAGYPNTSLVQPIAFIMPLIAVLLVPVVRKDLYNTVMSGFRANGLVFVAAGAGTISFLFYIYAETVPTTTKWRLPGDEPNGSLCGRRRHARDRPAPILVCEDQVQPLGDRLLHNIR
jgi:amino acid transporter